MNKLAWGIAGVVVLIVGIWVHDRTVAERALWEARDKVRAVQIDSLVKEGDVLKAKFKVDTLRLFKRIATTDTLLQTRIDSAIVQHTDTVKISVREAAELDTTIRSCKETVLSCARRADNAEAQTAIWRARFEDLSGQQPGYLRRHIGVVVGYGAFVTDGGVKVGPSITAGFRIWP